MKDRQVESLVLNVADAARMLNLSRATAYQFVREGKIPSVRFGKRILVPRKSLLAILGAEEP